jgi:hypothetical protein
MEPFTLAAPTCRPLNAVTSERPQVQSCRQGSRVWAGEPFRKSKRRAGGTSGASFAADRSTRHVFDENVTAKCHIDMYVDDAVTLNGSLAKRRHIDSTNMSRHSLTRTTMSPA